MIFSTTKKIRTLALTTTRGQVLYNKNASKSTKACATRTSDLFSMVILAMMMMVMATMAQDEGSGNGLAAGSEDILSKYNLTFDFPRAMKCLNPAP